MYRAHRFPSLALFVLLLMVSFNVSAQTTHVVTVGDNFFSPSQLTIQVGDTVRWENAVGGMAHDVTSDDGSFPGSQTATSFTHEVTFNEPGQYGYFCTVHAGQMQGTITVEGAASDEAEIELLSVSVVNEGSVSQNALESSGSSKSSPQAFAQGDQIDVEADIRNNGTASSGDFSITFYASVNSSINVSDTELGSFAVADLSPGSSRTQNHSLDIPESLPAGQYFIGAIVSYSDADSGNNTAVDNTSVTILGVLIINAGLNDVWATPGKNGQGILIAVFPLSGVFFSAWFTYESIPPAEDTPATLGAPDQRWVTMQGGFEGNTATLDVFISTGGVFDMAEPAPGNPIQIGTASIVFHDCDNATLTYDIAELGLANTEPLVRIVGDNSALCEELNSALQP